MAPSDTSNQHEERGRIPPGLIMPSSNNVSSRLLSMPREITDNIFNKVLDENYQTSVKGSVSLAHPCVPAIAQVCKIIRTETAQLFIQGQHLLVVFGLVNRIADCHQIIIHPGNKFWIKSDVFNQTIQGEVSIAVRPNKPQIKTDEGRNRFAIEDYVSTTTDLTTLMPTILRMLPGKKKLECYGHTPAFCSFCRRDIPTEFEILFSVGFDLRSTGFASAVASHPERVRARHETHMIGLVDHASLVVQEDKLSLAVLQHMAACMTLNEGKVLTEGATVALAWDKHCRNCWEKWCRKCNELCLAAQDVQVKPPRESLLWPFEFALKPSAKVNVGPAAISQLQGYIFEIMSSG